MLTPEWKDNSASAINSIPAKKRVASAIPGAHQGSGASNQRAVEQQISV